MDVWTFLESVAILPQVVAFNRTPSVDEWASHFVGGLGLARLFHLVFWLSSYGELNDKYNSAPGGRHASAR